MTSKKILICDDQKRFIDNFKKNHSGYYDIMDEMETRRLLDKIKKYKPDLLLLDLYYPKDDNDDFEDRRQKAEAELAKLSEQIENTKKAVSATWEPRGIDILKEIRNKYDSKKLPVIIYTQRGLFLLDDKEVRSVTQNKGHWMLKNEYHPHTEQTIMDGIIEDSKKLNNYKLYNVLTSGAILGLLASLFLFERDVVISIATGAGGSLLAFLVQLLLTRKSSEKYEK